jgi:hypothetical protein
MTDSPNKDIKRVVNLENFNPHLKKCNINSPRSREAAKRQGIDMGELMVKSADDIIKEKNLTRQNALTFLDH